MSDEIKENEVLDTYKEHNAYHQSYHTNCSQCYKEHRLIAAQRTVNRKILEGQNHGWQEGRSFDNYQSGDNS